MKTICALLLLLSPLYSWAQTQTKSQCMTTVRVRSMSISTADAEKLCAEDSAEVVNCAVTKLQGSRSGGVSESVKACRSEWGFASPTPSPSPTSAVVPTENSKSNDKNIKKKHETSEDKGEFEEL